MLTSLLTIALAPGFAAPLADVDNDGIPDDWEVNGHGPLRAGICRPDRADLILVYSIRPDTDARLASETMLKVRDFFQNVPAPNPDRTTGITVHIYNGNVVPADKATTSYKDLYETCLPTEWRGMAHGLIIDKVTGGGGQTDRPDWTSSSNNWMTIVHELGHQLELSHHPANKLLSPMYASLMNYDYSYRFAETAAIRFSTGNYDKYSFNETRLSETVPFSAAELDYLTKGPYFFRIQAVNAGACFVDWNRNGVFGEFNVRADINDGYSLDAGTPRNFGLVRSTPALTSLGDRLLIFAQGPEGTWGGSDPLGQESGPGRPARLSVVSALPTTFTTSDPLSTGVTGPASAETIGNVAFVAYPVGGDYHISAVTLPSPLPSTKPVRSALAVVPKSNAIPLLIRTTAPETLWVFEWQNADAPIAYRKVETADAASGRLTVGERKVLAYANGAPVKSQYLFGGAWDDFRKRMTLVVTQRRNNEDGEMRTVPILEGGVRRPGSQKGEAGVDWHAANEGRTLSGMRASGRPAAIFESARPGEPSRLEIFYKVHTADPSDRSAFWVYRESIDPNQGPLRATRLIDEWNTGRSAPAVTYYNREISVGLRLDMDGRNLMNVFPRGSGINPENIVADRNDVSHIMTVSLSRSLRAVRGEL